MNDKKLGLEFTRQGVVDQFGYKLNQYKVHLVNDGYYKTLIGSLSYMEIQYRNYSLEQFKDILKKDAIRLFKESISDCVIK